MDGFGRGTREALSNASVISYPFGSWICDGRRSSAKDRAVNTAGRSFAPK
jgi:hypothetical protein